MINLMRFIVTFRSLVLATLISDQFFFSSYNVLENMWGCGFDDRDEENGETAALKQEFMHEPVHSVMTFPNPPLGIPVYNTVSIKVSRLRPRNL